MVLKKYGVETAIEILNYAHQNTNALKSFVTEHCIECDLSFSGFLALALSSQELTEVIESVSALTKHGFVGEYFDASKCAELTRSQDFLGGIFYTDAGQLCDKIGYRDGISCCSPRSQSSAPDGSL